jgi:hypothetical protein
MAGFLQLSELLRTNLCSLHALLAALGHEGNGLAFFQALETVGFDGFEVYEQVVTATLRVMKPKPFSSLNHLTVPVWRLDMVNLQKHDFFRVRCCQATGHGNIIV